MVLWQKIYVNQWDATFHYALHYTLGFNVLVAVACFSSLSDLASVWFFLCLGLSLGSFLLWYICSELIRAIYNTRADGSDQVAFFFGYGAHSRPCVTLAVSLIAYLPLIQACFGLLAPLLSQASGIREGDTEFSSGAAIGLFIIGCVGVVLYMVVVP
jgi:hypothetical protein